MERYDLAAKGAENCLWDWDLTTGRIHYSPGWISMIGCAGTEFCNKLEEWFSRIHPEDLDSVQREINTHIAQGSIQFEIRHRLLHQDGCYRWVSCQGVITRDNTGRATRIAGFHVDITAEKVVDPLTGLPNRLLLMDRLTRSIEKAKKHDDFLFAFLIIDLDLFESGIDRLETINTDSLIVAAARRLETALSDETVKSKRRAHLVARSAGEEFMVLLDGLSALGEARHIADAMLKAITAPFDFNGGEAFLTPSIGIALSATGYQKPEEALRDADTALYRAKAFGKSRCEIFDTAVLESTRARNLLERDLDEALARNEFVVFYQPIISLVENRIAGFEALVRWKNPARGIVSPNEFLHLAEKTGLIIPLDRWVLQEACRQLSAWKEDPRIAKDLWVSVNLSGTQFGHSSLAKEIQAILVKLNFDASSLVLELTEEAVMEDPEAARSLLMQLHLMGAKIGLDDFGTGYSSLAHLRRFPLDYLKIDQSFVKTIENSPDTREIIKTIGTLARQLGLRVIAEGIEDSRQLELIRSLQCEYGQGYLYSKPVDAEGAKSLLLESFTLNKNEASESADLSSEPAEINRGYKSKWTIGKYIVVGFSALLLLVSCIVAMSGLRAARQHASAPKVMTGAIQAKTQPAPETPVKAITGVADKNAVKAVIQPKSEQKKTAEYPTCQFSVVHDHVLGNCTGTLKATGAKVLFVSEKAKDSFEYPYSACSFSFKDAQVTLKAGAKTYRFKSAAGSNKQETKSRTAEIYQSFVNIGTKNQATP